MHDLLNEPLFQSLADGIIPFYEVMSAFNIKVTIADLPSSILGFVYLSRKGRYHLVINGNVNFYIQRKTFIHEIKHIINDMPRNGYIIGLDMNHDEIEMEAEKIAEYFGKKYDKKIQNRSKLGAMPKNKKGGIMYG